jgi:hypothetical protein
MLECLVIYEEELPHFLKDSRVRLILCLLHPVAEDDLRPKKFGGKFSGALFSVYFRYKNMARLCWCDEDDFVLKDKTKLVVFSKYS